MRTITITGSTSSLKRNDLSWVVGEDVTITDTLSPITNITGWAIEFWLRRRYGDDVPLIIKRTGGAGITIDNGAGGVYSIVVGSSDTARPDVDDGAFVYEIRRTDSGQQVVLSHGTVTLLPSAKLS